MKPDSNYRFLFQTIDARGHLIRLDQALTDSLAAHDYSPPLKCLLGEFLTASVLLAETIKFEGRLILQARSQAALSLIAAEATSRRSVRGVLRVNEPISHAIGAGALVLLYLQTLLDGGTMVVTFEPDQGERYQSLVPIESSSLAGCLEFYFGQSDQLGTFLFLHCNGREAFGFLLQQLPPQLESDAAKRANQWEHLVTLAQTITPEEINELGPAHLLRRLFGEESISLYEEEGATFACTCSNERMANALIALGDEELTNMFEEQPVIEIGCEFCGRLRQMSRQDVADIARNGESPH